jgi:hypothetical protein
MLECITLVVAMPARMRQLTHICIYNFGFAECFDFLYLMFNRNLRAVQVTNAIKHDYKLLILVPYEVKLKCTEVEIVVICLLPNLKLFIAN